MPAASSIDPPRATASARPWLRAPGRLVTLWRTKLQLYALLFAAFGIPYFVLQRWPVFTPGRFALTSFDLWVGFHPGWIWVYQSVYVLISVPPLLSVSSAQLAVYARGFLWMTAIAVLFYVFLPIEAPRPADVPRDGMWRMLLLYDRTINTFPSLHVAMATHSLCFGAWLTGPRRSAAARLALAAGALWLLLVMYSTLATKQHYVVDLPAGVALGIICQWMAAGFRSRLTQTALEGRTA
jgi:membrane-associated phospholipid phosphatase